MITIQRKRQALLLIAAALTAVLLLAGGLPEMRLSPGAPFPGGSGDLTAASNSGEGSPSISSGTTWMQGVTALVTLGLAIYAGINLARKAPYKKLLRGVLVALVLWAILSIIPALNSPPLEAPANEPGMAETTSLTYEVIELGAPPASFVRSITAVLLALAVAGGLLAGGSPSLLLVGLVAALAAWDLEHSISSLAGNAKTEFGQDQENKRLLLLAGVVGLSLLLTSLGLLLRLSLPFGVMVLLALVALGSISMLGKHLQKKPMS